MREQYSSELKKWEFAAFVPGVVRDFVFAELNDLEFCEVTLGSSEPSRRIKEILQKLSVDDRVSKVYSLLTQEPAFRDPRRWQCFLRASLRARSDFCSERDELKKAANLRAEILEAASQLEKLLLEMNVSAMVDPDDEPIGFVDWPEELFSMPMRRQYFESAWSEFGQFRLTPGLTESEIERVSMSIKPKEVVSEIKRLVGEWTPGLGLAAGAAMVVVHGSQIPHARMQLIRSFWWELSAINGWPRIDHWEQTIGLMKAIAEVLPIVAEDDPNGDLSYETVKYALKLFAQKRA